MPRMPPRLPALVPGPGWFLQPPPLLSSSLTLNCLYSTQQPAGSLLKLSQIMSFLCSNLPIFRSEEELKSLQAAWDFTPRFPDLLSHFFTPPASLCASHSGRPAISQAGQARCCFGAFAPAVPRAWTRLHGAVCMELPTHQVFRQMLSSRRGPPSSCLYLIPFLPFL